MKEKKGKQHGNAKNVYEWLCMQPMEKNNLGEKEKKLLLFSSK